MAKLPKWYNDGKKHTLENLDSEDLCVLAFALKLQQNFCEGYLESTTEPYPEDSEEFKLKMESIEIVKRRIKKSQVLKEQLEYKHHNVKYYDTMI